MSALVSVIMTCHNAEGSVARSIESVLRQNFIGFEFVIVDDHSSDSTLKIIKECAARDRRIILIRNEGQLGIPRSVNRALRVSQGAYIARIDSDDSWIDGDKLSQQVAFLEANHEYIAVGGGMVVVDENGKELFRYLKPEHDEEIRTTALLTNPIANSTSLCRRDVIDAGVNYNESLSVSEDWEFWLRVGTFGKLYNFPYYLSHYTMASSGNHSLQNMRNSARVGMRIIRTYRRYYPGYARGFAVNTLQYLYGCMPQSMRFQWNMSCSRLKKMITGSKVV